MGPGIWSRMAMDGEVVNTGELRGLWGKPGQLGSSQDRVLHQATRGATDTWEGAGICGRAQTECPEFSGQSWLCLAWLC